MKLLGAIVLVFSALCAHAGEAVSMAEDEAVEQRLIAIAAEVRCLVCQNESLAGSRAELAQDLRREIRSLVKAGKTDAEILEFLVSRYGDFVRYRPPLKPSTWLLWIGPFIFLGLGLSALAWQLQRRRHDETPLSADDRARAAKLLTGES
jgi:cytochrome c-type biogenesis protein CcmH